MSEIRYGLIGAGYFGSELARALTRLPAAKITHVFDPESGAAAAQEFGAIQCASIEELCANSDVDAVIVASPNWAHREPVVLAAKNGKHVFCEKPIALSYDDCVTMIDATKSAAVTFMAGHVMNFMNGVRRVKAMIADNAIGDVLFTRAVRTGWEDAQEHVSWKKQRALSGGHLYHHIHELDLVQFIMGPAIEVTMVGGNVAHTGGSFGDEDDMLIITLEFGNNTFAALEYGSAFRWSEHYVLIQGTLGAIRIDLQDVGITVTSASGSERFLLHRSEEEDNDRTRIYRESTTDGGIMYGSPGGHPPLWLAGIVEEEMKYFHGLMTGGQPQEEFRALTDGSAATAAIATADALTLSLRESRKVRVSEITG